jgi:hypothetical protein
VLLGLAIDIHRNDTVHNDGDITAVGAIAQTVVITAREELQIAHEARQVHPITRLTLTWATIQLFPPVLKLRPWNQGRVRRTARY